LGSSNWQTFELKRASFVLNAWPAWTTQRCEGFDDVGSFGSVVLFSDSVCFPERDPSFGILAAQTLSRSFFFLFPGVTHGVKTTNPCPGTIEHAFLDHPTVRPDANCISRMPELEHPIMLGDAMKKAHRFWFGLKDVG
jgi:hypothetical protein